MNGYVEISLLSYLIDKFIGEFKFIKHPVIFMGEFIKWFEKKFYKNSILRGFFLNISLLALVFIISFTLSFIFSLFNFYIELILTSIVASMGIASKMLYDSVNEVLSSNEPKKAIAMLVSRDSENLSESDINKACIETYAENLSDGVIAPLFYLLLFGLEGIMIYKAINTLDSMVGYKNEKYINFGKFSAKLDDIANFIPARISAFLIAILSFKLSSFKFLKFAKLHESPNAGYPISAMACSLNLSLGGATSYFGKIKNKPYFGDGKKEITKIDVKKALNFRNKIDLSVIFILIFLILTQR